MYVIAVYMCVKVKHLKFRTTIS